MHQRNGDPVRKVITFVDKMMGLDNTVMIPKPERARKTEKDKKSEGGSEQENMYCWVSGYITYQEILQRRVINDTSTRKPSEITDTSSPIIYSGKIGPDYDR